MQTLNRYLFGTVFLTGAAVLILEVAAVRILAPYYGSSLYVFSSVLTVILAALSIGYWFGGVRADRKQSIDELYMLIATSGLLVIILLLVAVTVLPAFSALFPVSVGPLVFSAGLFFFPAFLLGIVSPYIIKIQSVHTPTEEIGSVVGKTFFWGTLGSIVGSLLSGFYLIPTLGVELSITFVSIILIAVGCVTPLFLGRPLHKRWIIGVSILAILFAGCLHLLTQHRNEIYIYHADGLYSSITISDRIIYGQNARLLNRDTNNSSAIFYGSTELVFDYTQFIKVYPELMPEAKTMLMLGGGAYTVPRTVVATDPDITVDVVEIEPVLFDLAQEYFDLHDTSRITNYPEDARVFLSRTDKKYDVIFADLFSTNMAAPFHLTTYEYYSLLKDHLTPDGILLINYAGKPVAEAPSLTGSVIKTFTSVFTNSKAYMLRPHRKTQTQNIIFIARNGEVPIEPKEQLFFYSEFDHPFEKMDMKLSSYDTTGEYLLTDDFAPVEKLMAKQR